MRPAKAPTFDRREVAAIARAFLPARWYGNRTPYYYVRTKLASDPLYSGIVEVLRDNPAPLLDLGCGLGLLAHTLRQAGLALPYRGVDNDAGKIARAAAAARSAGLAHTEFETMDLATSLPQHRGSVALLDVLQFLPPDAQDRLLDAAIAMLTPGASLVLRSGLHDDSWRARVTYRVDQFSRWIRWMNVGPTRYPARDALAQRFAAAGLTAEFSPLFGRTPFNNWRIVATRQS
ncbi:MAG: methyltransferase domain-containing protein [Rhodanobacteraceae bacterium]|nr:methyltransferase domain-containing protein [Rhodanobacteraceae bacterium]